MAVAETDVHDRRTANAVERPVDRGDPVARRLVRGGAHPRFVDLHDIDAGGLQLAQFLVHRGGEVHRQLRLVGVELVLCLLRQRERAGDRDLRRARRVRQQELGVAPLDRPLAPDPPGHARYRRGAAVGADHRAGIDRVEAVERQAEIIRVALAADLAVTDDIDAGPLHLADRDNRRIVLRFAQLRLRDAPDLMRMHPRHAVMFERRAVDQPIRLRIAADDRRRDQMRGIDHSGNSACRHPLDLLMGPNNLGHNSRQRGGKSSPILSSPRTRRYTATMTGVVR